MEKILLIPSGEVIEIDRDVFNNFKNKTYNKKYDMYLVDDKYKTELGKPDKIKNIKTTNKIEAGPTQKRISSGLKSTTYSDTISGVNEFIKSLRKIRLNDFNHESFIENINRFNKLNYNQFERIMNIITTKTPLKDRNYLATANPNHKMARSINFLSDQYSDYYKKWRKFNNFIKSLKKTSLKDFNYTGLLLAL